LSGSGEQRRLKVLIADVDVDGKSSTYIFPKVDADADEEAIVDKEDASEEGEQEVDDKHSGVFTSLPTNVEVSFGSRRGEPV